MPVVVPDFWTICSKPPDKNTPENILVLFFVEKITRVPKYCTQSCTRHSVAHTGTGLKVLYLFVERPLNKPK